jgi:hypothetical protein
VDLLVYDDQEQVKYPRDSGVEQGPSTHRPCVQSPVLQEPTPGFSYANLFNVTFHPKMKRPPAPSVLVEHISHFLVLWFVVMNEM